MTQKKTIPPTNPSEQITELLNAEDKKGEWIVRKHAALAAAAGSVPIPLVDFAAVSGVTLNMLRQLAAHYKVEFRTETARAGISSLVNGGATVLAYQPMTSFISIIPGVGHLAKLVVGPLVTGPITYAVGRVFLLHFSQGGTFYNFDPNQFHDYFSEMVRGNKFENTVAVNEDINQNADTNNETAIVPKKPTESVEDVDAELDRLSLLTAASVAGSGLAIASAVAPPLRLLALPLALLPSIPLAYETWREYADEKQLGFKALLTLTSGLLLATGYLAAVGLANMIVFGGKYLVLKTRKEGEESLSLAVSDWNENVWVLNNGVEIETPLDQVEEGALVVVRPGRLVPVDGTIAEGELMVDNRMFTGESRLVEITVGDEILAGAMVVSGRGLVKTENTGAETKAARLETLIADMQSYEQQLDVRSQEMADRSMLPTLGLGALGMAAWGPLGAVSGVWSNSFDLVWVFGPAAMLRMLRTAADSGILIKDGRSLDLLGDIDTVVFDKTGTLTHDSFALGELYPDAAFDKDTLLKISAAAELGHEHPIARAIVEGAEDQGIDLSEVPVEEPSFQAGLGLKLIVDDKLVLLGSRRLLMNNDIELPEFILEKTAASEAVGCTVVHLAINSSYAGAIELVPKVRSETQELIDRLHARGMEVMVLSGDEEEPTRRLAQSLGIDTWFSRTLPEQKSDRIAELCDEGRKVCFIGDGVNDALAMRRAHVSISMTGASAIAVDSAQIILNDGSLTRLDAVFELGKRHETSQNQLAMAALVPTAINFTGVLFLGVPLVALVGVYSVAVAANLGITYRKEDWDALSIDTAEEEHISKQ
ncbi:HAD-IC family P-type ATPase [Candidatus Albibeggiatoa sp. nov. NOAA]|uniref:HAD-IC family P-type ATPase n=1 Tax=Candidatus Albibeggiatoa sp. nov. NOAA TaxID=3162724 RepID=UPI0032F4D35A|nr:HAD-IC family P-type ATPase [Thiotrichaceae bacterium]